jgi:LacI family sucrose operon transcriptional repressor
MSISLEDLARRAKVSKTTVSLVINGKSEEYRISKETQKKIQVLAKEYNFKPNSTARALRLKKSLTIGLIIPYLNRHFGRVAEVLEQTAREAGYQIIIAITDDCLETEYDLINNLAERNIDGLILATMMNRDQYFKNPVIKKMPVMLIDRRLEGDDIGWVVSDDETGTYDLVSTLCKEGIQDIHFIGGIQKLSTSIDRLKGYKKALRDQGIGYDQQKVQQTGYAVKDGYEMTKNIFQKIKQGPQAIFTSAITLLEGLLQYTKEHDSEMLNITRVITYDDHPMLDYLQTPIISVRQNAEEIAKKAFEVMHGILEQNKEFSQELIKPKLILR